MSSVLRASTNQKRLELPLLTLAFTADESNFCSYNTSSAVCGLEAVDLNSAFDLPPGKTCATWAFEDESKYLRRAPGDSSAPTVWKIVGAAMARVGSPSSTARCLRRTQSTLFPSPPVREETALLEQLERSRPPTVQRASNLLAVCITSSRPTPTARAKLWKRNRRASPSHGEWQFRTTEPAIECKLRWL